MIRLENVSTSSLIDYINISGYDNRTDKSIYDFLVKNNITNYKILQEMLENKESELVDNNALQFLRYHLKKVKERINRANSRGFEPEIFTFDNYKNTNIDDENLSITDKNTNGNVLLYALPFIKYGARLNVLNRLSIDEIKHLLGHIDGYNLRNALTMKRSFGNGTAERVVELIDFYEQQVLRQASETEERGINLFAFNKDKKDEIVEAQLKEIIEYILDSASECVWGKMTDTSKKRMLAAALSRWGKYVQRDKRALIDAISNYTTLGELENDIFSVQEVPTIIGGVITRTKTKPIDRFIVR